MNIGIKCMYVYTHCVYMYVYLCMFVFMEVCVYLYIYVCVYVRTYVDPGIVICTWVWQCNIILNLSIRKVLKFISLFTQIREQIEEISNIITRLLTSLVVPPDQVQTVQLYIDNITRSVVPILLRILQELNTEPTTGILIITIEVLCSAATKLLCAPHNMLQF
jgi:hypothetical protein